MSDNTVVVAGDVTVDWMMVPIDATAGDSDANFRQYAARHSLALPGGALLLATMTEQCLKRAGAGASVVGPSRPATLSLLSPTEVIHSNVALRQFTATKGDGKPAILRVSEHFGYHGPSEGVPPQPAAPDPERARVIVLDDAGNGFRSSRDAWPRALSDKNALVVLKMSRPIAEGALWLELLACRDRLAVVLRAEDLRRLAGVHISRSLSWERTAKEFLFHMRRSAALEPLHRAAHLIVTFDTDGAIWYRPGDCDSALLVYDPATLEEGMAATLEGGMLGLTSMLTATLAAALHESGFAGIERGIRQGLARQRAMLKLGYQASDKRIDLPYAEIFKQAKDGAYCSAEIEPVRDLERPDPDFFRILTAKTRFVRTEVARDMVVHGRSDALSEVPVGRFGKLMTIDRAEIEAYGAIRELLDEFLDNPKPARPLCFAVFGPPGAGKSYGVKQVAASLGNKSLAPITFNISQFRGYDDLVSALHRVRDLAIAGKIPFVFFDEFDAALGGQPLGWLQYFLAPMQDGEFKGTGETPHSIGRAVFVFAGGTRSSYERFAQNLPDEIGDDADGRVRDGAREEFRKAKGPDFVSRLRGFIDIMGPNRQRRASRNDDDEAFVIRRAIVLRSMLTGNAKTAGLVDRQDRVRIDEGVLRALLFLEGYRHGMRSMDAVLDMSRLAGRSHFDVSCLPSREQLAMHVDADELYFLAEQERFRTMLPERDLPKANLEHATAAYRAREDALIEAVARGIHADYRKRREAEGKSSDAIVAWETLSEEKRRSNLDAAADVPNKLRAVGHGLRRIPAGQEARIPDLMDAEVETLARMEHERWCREERMQSLAYGPTPSKSTSPYLVDYDRLPQGVRRYDVESVEALPCILRDLGYEIFRLQEIDDLRDAELVERLAQVVHENYVEKRTADGDTVHKNSSLRSYDELSDTLKRSNRDVARSIKRRLTQIGYRIHPVPPGRNPEPFQLAAENVERLAEQEHARWAWERRLDGWTYKPGAKDERAKTTPHLAPWNDLPDDIKRYDRENVMLLPELLRRAGYEAARSKG